MSEGWDHDVLQDVEASDAVRRWVDAARELNDEYPEGPEYIDSSARIDKVFLGYLRTMERFGAFNYGPITISLPLIEREVERSVANATVGEGLKTFIHLSDLIQAEVKRSGRRRVDELHLLLAFMRIGVGLPARVFGELGVTPEQVEDYSRNATGLAQSLEKLFSPEEAAAYLKVHVQTVREWIRNGRLKAFRLAGQRALRIRSTDLQSVLEPLEGEANVD